jgi:hypothetical protein
MLSNETMAKFDALIGDMPKTVGTGTEAAYQKVEEYGYFVHRVVRRFMQAVDYTAPAYNSTQFNDPKRQLLVQVSDKVANSLIGASPADVSEELTYVLYQVALGIFQSGNFATSWKAMFTGILENVKLSAGTAKYEKPSDQKSIFMNTRRYYVTLGALTSVINKIETGWTQG